MVPPEVVWEGGSAEPRRTIALGPRQVELAQGADGVQRVSRLISTEPRDFLDARWIPGRQW